jgi:hypothetical protein
MIANFATILIGLWLAYRVIFSIPAGEMNQTEMIVAGVAVILLALWARRSDFMGWYSATSIILGLIILVLAALHRTVGVEPLVSFWMILLIAITVAIVAMWSILYRPNTTQPAEPR